MGGSQTYARPELVAVKVKHENATFEKLHIEVRDLIYDRRLLYDDKIVPFLRGCEKKGDEKGKASAQQTSLGPPHSGLLGANSTAGDEAQISLYDNDFGRPNHAHNDMYPKDFRNVVTTCDYRDADPVLFFTLAVDYSEGDAEDCTHSDQIGHTDDHTQQLDFLQDELMSKKNILYQEDLESLSFDFPKSSYCSTRCYHYEAFQRNLQCLESSRSWYELRQEQGGDSSPKLETDREIRGSEDEKEKVTDVDELGLKYQMEKELVWDTWGLKDGKGIGMS